MEAKELQESFNTMQEASVELKKSVTELQEKVEKNEGVAELNQKLDRIEKDVAQYDELNQKMELIEKAQARALAHASVGSESNSEEEIVKKTAILNLVRAGMDKDAISVEDQKALTPANDKDGGFTLPATMVSEIQKIVYETSPMRSVASVATVGTNEYKGLYDNDLAGTSWEGLNTNSGNDSTPEYEEFVIPVHRLRSRPQIHEELLDDSMFNLETELSNKVGQSMALVENTAFVNGDGNKKPKGFTSYAASADADVFEQGKIGQIETAAAADLDFDDIYSLVYGLKDEYLANARLAMSRQIMAVARKLKDNQGRYLWEASNQVGQPSTIAGVPVLQFNDMSKAVASDNIVMAIADWSRTYKIVDRLGVSVLRDPYTNNPFVKYIFRKRVGGQVVNFDSIKLLKVQ